MLRRATIGLKRVALSALIVGAFTYAVADRNPLGVAGGKAMAMTSTPLPGTVVCWGVCGATMTEELHKNYCDIRNWCAGYCEYIRYDKQYCKFRPWFGNNCRGVHKASRQVSVYRTTGCFESSLGCACNDEKVYVGTRSQKVPTCKSC